MSDIKWAEWNGVPVPESERNDRAAEAIHGGASWSLSGDTLLAVSYSGDGTYRVYDCFVRRAGTSSGHRSPIAIAGGETE